MRSSSAGSGPACRVRSKPLLILAALLVFCGPLMLPAPAQGKTLLAQGVKRWTSDQLNERYRQNKHDWWTISQIIRIDRPGVIEVDPGHRILSTGIGCNYGGGIGIRPLGGSTGQPPGREFPPGSYHVDFQVYYNADIPAYCDQEYNYKIYFTPTGDASGGTSGGASGDARAALEAELERARRKYQQERDYLETWERELETKKNDRRALVTGKYQFVKSKGYYGGSRMLDFGSPYVRRAIKAGVGGSPSLMRLYDPVYGAEHLSREIEIYEDQVRRQRSDTDLAAQEVRRLEDELGRLGGGS